MAAGINMKLVAKIPNFIKTSAEEIKADITEIKDAINDFKTNLAKMRADV